MSEPSYVPVWLYLHTIGDEIGNWLNRIPVEDGPILTRRHVLFGLCSLFPEIRGDEAEIRYFLSLLETFEQQWGPLSLETLLHVAYEHAPVQDSPLAMVPPSPSLVETGRPERMVRRSETKDDELLRFVLTTLGATESEPTRRALLYLGGPIPWERWRSALWLGHVREPQALPILRRMLTEYWPLSKTFGNRFDVQSFAEDWQHQVPEVLWRWGDPGLAVDLRRALIDVMQSEQTDWAPPPGPLPASVDPDSVWATYYLGLGEWTSYEHQLVYGLGRLGAFGALIGVETPVGIYNESGGMIMSGFPLSNLAASEHTDRFRGNLWRVHACCGYLEPAFRVSVTPPGEFDYPIMDYWGFDYVPEFAQAVQQVLRDQVGLDQTACQEAMQDYDQAGYLGRTLAYYARVTKIVEYNASA